MANAFNRTLKQIGLLVVGGLIATGVVGGGTFLNKLDTSGDVQESDYFAADLPIVFDVAATGSTAAKSGTAYDAACISSPLTNSAIDAGSGLIIRLAYHNITNPAAANGFIGFVKSCDDQTASGAHVLPSLSTQTGAVNVYASGSLVWNGDDKLKVTLTKDPTSAYDAKVTVKVEDILGE